MRRLISFANGQYYHVFNRTNDRKLVFVTKRLCQRMLVALDYYRYKNPPMRLSYFLSLPPDRRENIFSNLGKENREIVDVICFCLMPNHFHLLLRQNEDNGISTYLAQLENSITRYFNTTQKRIGHLFEGQFKAVRIETDEQLLHINRYIHINPTTSYVVKTFDELLKYEWSSLPQYLGKIKKFCKPDVILSNFKDMDSYIKFLSDNVDYQRKLHVIKHTLVEDVEL